jgi:hypothetical protein
MGLLTRLFGLKDARGGGQSGQEVEVHFDYGSTNFQLVYALGDQIQSAVADAKVGEYDGHALPEDGSEGRYFICGPDAEAIYRVLAPMLNACAFMRGATVTLWFGAPGRRTPKRIIKMPE